MTSSLTSSKRTVKGKKSNVCHQQLACITEFHRAWKELLGTTAGEDERKDALTYKANCQYLIPLLTFKIKLVDVFQGFMKKVKTSQSLQKITIKQEIIKVSTLVKWKQKGSMLYSLKKKTQKTLNTEKQKDSFLHSPRSIKMLMPFVATLQFLKLLKEAPQQLAGC